MPGSCGRQEPGGIGSCRPAKAEQLNEHTGRAIEAPLLPLVGNVVFPQSIYPLSLVGEQAAHLMQAALERGSRVALFLQREQADGPPGVGDLHRVGTLARIEDVRAGENGEISFQAVGTCRIALEEILGSEPFAHARVIALPETQTDDEQTQQLFAQVHELYSNLLAGSPEAAQKMEVALANSKSPTELAYLVAATLPISPGAKQAILELDSGAEKLLQLVPILVRAREMSVAKGATHPASEAGPRIEPGGVPKDERPGGPAPHGRSHVPGAVLLDRAELQTRLHEPFIPEEVRHHADRELDRLTELGSSSPDYAMVRSYLQCLVDLPWAIEDEPEIDLENARAILQRDHYGLDDVKERILEYLAVCMLRKQRSAQAGEAEDSTAGGLTPGDPVLCLVGPPGIGKTSLGKSVAEALGRPFIRISLGGVADEAEIRGHRRTYMGAMPGKIIQALTRTATSQPVIMLDEIDKVGASGKGDPASALLEVLDPEQQRSFLDHYLDLPYDLSRVFFIATANTLENAPPALRDRLEVIQLSGYTEEEKVQIALRHIIPRQMEWHALAPRETRWEPQAVLTIIRSYTREAGVRQLEREIATICRKVAALVAQGAEGRPDVIGPDFVTEALGSPRFLPAQAESSAQPGVVTGVVWTPVGGDIIHVEASIMPGSKTLTLTGQLGEVMRESAQAALSYVRAEAAALNVDPNFFERNDVHLHVPSGSVPKDGPSAGITMATALVSLLTNRAVPAETAMSGEITLRGRVLPVGGVKEKILAARRVGTRVLILPEANRRDVYAISSELLEGIDLVFADSMETVLSAAFTKPGRRKRAGARPSAKQSRARSDEDAGSELPRAAKKR